MDAIVAITMSTMALSSGSTLFITTVGMDYNWHSGWAVGTRSIIIKNGDVLFAIAKPLDTFAVL